MKCESLFDLVSQKVLRDEIISKRNTSQKESKSKNNSDRNLEKNMIVYTRNGKNITLNITKTSTHYVMEFQK